MGFRGKASDDGRVILTKEEAQRKSTPAPPVPVEGHQSVLSPREQETIRAIVDNGRARRAAGN